MEGKTRSTLPAKLSGGAAARLVPSQDHPLLGLRAPAFALKDAFGQTRDLNAEVADGPVIVIFYLGSTCMACVTHLVELDAALARSRDRGSRVLAVSVDAPAFSRERIRKFGGFQFPLLSDPDHTVSRNYGVWKTLPGGDPDVGEALHGSFIIDRGGLVRWAAVGDRPFTDINALVAELDRLAEIASQRISQNEKGPCESCLSFEKQ